MQRVQVLQGQALASVDPNTELSTVLGSCVATCLYDPFARVGGMNHFLLPEPPASHDRAKVDVHYGTYLMEILINEMLARGAIKSRMRAHLYGGANLRVGMAPIGSSNAEFARSFLDNEGIPLARSDLGGTLPRRVDFRPATGQVRCRTVSGRDPALPPVQPAAEAISRNRGEVELF